MSDETQRPIDVFLPVDIEEEMKRSYLDYAMSVIIGRALPDVRDGLKPVHRRVLYGMWESGNRAGRAYKKSARIVGDVMGKYHPHGDAAIYDTVVRMAQDFSMRYTLVDGQGNFGSVDGDNPAAMRYTEVRLTRLAEEMLRDDIDKETVDWLPNYDGNELEPKVLPARLPNLLINGSAGIAVGMATNIPPHNLGEVVDALLLLIESPQATLGELMERLPGPDFPTAGEIYGAAGIAEAYATGRGIIRVRARAEIEEMRNDRQAIVVTELPYQVNKAKLVERIADLVKEKRIEGIADLRDESDRRGIRVVVELKRGEIAEVILNQLFKLTPMQSTFGINLLAIVDQQPKVLSLREILQHFLDHRTTVVIRRTRFDLRKAEARAHILEGLLKALDLLDEIITTIRSSATPDEARERLMSEFSFTEVQAQAILDMRLQRLTGLEREKLIEEYREVAALIERLRAILASRDLLMAEIRNELEELKRNFADSRRTTIVSAGFDDITIEDMIADEPMVITVSRGGYVKRTPLSLYRSQHRGGKGRLGMATKDDDDVEQLYVATAHSTVLVFTESGKVHWLKVHQIPESAPTTRGKAIVNLLQIEGDERIATTVAVREFDDRHFLVFATEQGVVKRTELSAYANPRAGGIIAISLDEGDRLLAVRETDGKGDLMLATRNGISIRFPEHQVRSMGRNTRGVRGIDLREGDLVVSLAPLGQEGEILTVSERGYGKRTRVDEYRLQGRGGLGIINLKVTAKTGAVVGARRVEDGDDLVLVTEQGKLIRTSVEGIRSIGRSTQGVRVMDLDDDDRIVAIATVAATMLAVAQEGVDAADLDEPETETTTAVETAGPDSSEPSED